MKNKHRKQIRDDMAILGVFQKLPYLLKSPKHRMSAYHSAKRLKIGIVIREYPMKYIRPKANHIRLPVNLVRTRHDRLRECNSISFRSNCFH